MTVPSTQLSNVRNRFVRHVVVPTLAVSVFVLMAGAFGLYWTARQANAVSAEHQTRIARISVEDTLEDLAIQQQSAAAWPGFGNELTRPTHDPGWIDRVAGIWLYAMFEHQMVYVLDDADSPIYGSLNGHRVAANTFADVGKDVMPVVRLLRISLGTRPDIPDPPSLPSPSLLPVPLLIHRTLDMPHVSGIVRVSDRPMAISVMLVSAPSPVMGASPSAGPRNYVMIDMKPLDEHYLAGIFHRYSLYGVRFSDVDDVRPKEHVLVLRDPFGRSVGRIMWQPELPGKRILTVLVPVALTLAGVSSLVMGLLLLSFWRLSVAQARSLQELLSSERSLRILSEHDALTGLANRMLFDRHLAFERRPEIHGAPRLYDPLSAAGMRLGLFMIDLDRFKQVNDTLGHQAGDTLLRAFGKRLQQLFRPTDMVARLGGDEFAILIDMSEGAEQAAIICERLFNAMAVPFSIGGGEVHVGISIGVALQPDGGCNGKDLHRRADIALYQAKADGRNCLRVFSDDLERRLNRRNLLEDELRHALADRDGLFVCYQPQVDAETGRIVGFEALARWRRQNGELVSPQEFVGIAEETGLIRQLDSFVFIEAAAVARRRPDLFISVNLSPIQLRTPGFAQSLAQTIKTEGVTAEQIELEITEGVLLGNDEPTQLALDQLRQLGFRIALDDFGVGYSSLSYLRRLHVDKIKIDRSFIENIDNDPEALAIVECIVTLARAIGVKVTAEGVETIEQKRLLEAAGCDDLQGYLFSVPVCGADLDALVLQDFLVRSAEPVG